MTKSKPLSHRQQQVLDYIQEFITAAGYPPSVREIGAAVGLNSSSTVHKHLRTLETRGFLRRSPNQPRAIEVLTPGSDLDQKDSILQVPIIGRVAAGMPLLAEENLEGSFPMPAEFFSKGPLFLLRIRGESMKEAGILDGDYALVRQQPQVDNGNIAVVLMDNDATLKYFYQEEKYIRLEPANPDYQPIITDTIRVLGKVVGIMRFWP